MPTDNASYLSELHQLVYEYFNLEEIRTLCLQLNVDYESIPGAEKPSMIRELLLALGRNGRLPQLITLAQTERSFVEWPPVPDDFQMPTSLPSGSATMPLNQYHVYGDVVLGDKNVFEAGAVYQKGLSIEEVATLVVELKNQDQPIIWNGRFPYLGLTSFQESDAEFFFGRESLVDDLLERVQQANFIVIAGPSGSGKSSVARAGLFHALRSGQLTKSDSWLLATMQPKGDPIEQLALALERATKSTQIGDAIRADGASNPALLSRQIEMHLTDDPRQRCVILVDQFEETFTQTKNEDTRAAFINLLTTAAQAEAGRIVILLSLRSDFISHCARYPELRRLMSQQFQLVGAMAPPDLAKAITLPALEVGAEIDPALVSRIMADMKGEPGALPLMSFALRDLFEAEKSAKGQPMDLTLPEYVARGGIESALERHAKKVFDDFSDEQKVLARGVFSKLIEVGQGRADTRRTATFQELVPAGTNQEAVEAVVIALAQEDVRLITTDGATNGEEITHEAIAHATVTIAHEKLIDAWPWLRQLVDENREMIALQNQIHDASQAWAQAKDAGFLYRGGRLLQVEERLQVANPSLDVTSQAFIQTSLDHRQKEIEEKEAQRRRTITSLSIASVVAITLASIAFLFFLRSNNNAEMASENLMTATAALYVAKIANEDAILQRNQAQVASIAKTIALSTSEAALQEAKIQRLQAEARALAAESARLFSGGASTEALVLAVSAVGQTYNAPETCGTVVEEADLAFTQALFSPNLLSVSLTDHTNWVWSASFSPDGSRIVTASDDNTAKVWLADTGKLLLNLSGHTDRVLSATFSPDGNRIVTTSSDTTAKVWHADTGDLLLNLSDHTQWVLSATFSPDGSRIVTASSDNTAKVWHADTGKLLLDLTGHMDSVLSPTFSPDGSRIATASFDNTAKVWHADTGKLLFDLADHTHWISSVSFSPDGRRIVTASYDTTAKVWHADTGKLLFDLTDHTGSVMSASFSPDGSRVTTASADNTAKVWQADTGKLLLDLTGHTGSIWLASFSRDGSHIITASNDNTAKVWLADTGKLLFDLTDHTDLVRSAGFSPDGSRIVTTSDDTTAKVWLLDSSKLLFDLSDHMDTVRSPTFSPDGSRIVTASDDNTAKVWHADTGELLLDLTGHMDSVRSANFSPDGSRIVTASSDTTAKVWDADTGKLLFDLTDHTHGISSASFSPDGSRIVTASYDTTAKVWHADTGKLFLNLTDHTDSVLSASFSPDGSRIVTTSDDTTAKVWHADTGKLLLDLTGHMGWVNSAAFSPDGTRIVTASQDYTAKVWDADTGKLLLDLTDHTNWVWSASFSPDGSRIVTASDDTTAKVWQTNSGKLLFDLTNHTDLVRSASFSSDGSRIVTASWDTIAKLWHANTGQLLLDLTDHTRSVNSASFSPDGSRIVTASDDNTTKVWHADTSKVGMMLAIAKDRLARLLPPEEFAAIFDTDTSCTPD